MSNFKNFFPSELLKGDFSVFAEVMSNEMSRVEDLIFQMSTLNNVDRCPKAFLNELFKLIDYRLYDDLDDDLQRECVKYYIPQSKNIGLTHDISMMATHGDNPGYKGGNLFVPGTYSNKPLAGVVFPRDRLFSWCKSSWSGKDRFPGNKVYREGTILIEVTNLNQIIMDRVEKIKPAGMLIVYKLVKNGELTYITHTRVLE